MPISTQYLDGTSKDLTAVLQCLNELLTLATDLMNAEMLPRGIPLFPDDVLPTNQRNLTDVRVRLGVLLEYELAKAVNASLPSEIKDAGLVLTYVVANQFPDLAFRSPSGELGIRFEMKAIEAVAEEKSANFSTLIKDIRKGTDFVVVLLWEWMQHDARDLKFPRIDAFFVMDAYHLAQMRDCHWLNNPPSGLQLARQGFDLTFAVNAKADVFNEEEGNYGKLMRIFDPKHQHLLSTDVQESDTLQTYYRLTAETARLGLVQIGSEITAAAVQEEGQACTLGSDELPVSFVAERNGSRLLIIGGRRRLAKNTVVKAMEDHGAGHALLLNEKFKWAVYDDQWNKISEGGKPAEAVAWVKEQWPSVIQRLV